MNITLGLSLMLIGMLTVSVIMLLIVYVIRLLTKAINMFAPEDNPVAHRPSASGMSVDSLTIDIISAAVADITGGRGSVRNVQKLP
jgi:oxaloacetate decarboxylase gamma subunit